MVTSTFIAVVLVSLTVLIHYESLRLTANIIPKLNIPARTRIIVVIMGAFIAHIIEIHVYAAAYFLMATQWGLGELKHFTGAIDGNFDDYIYYSMVSYTSLGLGDVWPKGGLRLVTGVEALNGLILIAWTASFTYLAMEKFWVLPHSRRKKKSK